MTDNPIEQVIALVKHVGTRIDALSLDLAQGGGAIVRDARALAELARGRATTFVRATPRVTRIAQAAAGVLARQRWLRLVQVAKTGTTALRDDDHRELARRVAGHAAELRGGIAKLGQLASCRPDLVGAIWAGELAALQDEVPPVDPAAIRARVEAELGRPVGEVFADFAAAPLAAASLAQVHAATLHDGTAVVVKVQVPGIEDVIAADIAALAAIAGAIELPGLDLATLSAELGRALARELDYEAEADALWAYTGAATVPVPIATASSRRVLTMTRIDGERLVPWLERASADERDRLLGELVGEVAAQILVRGQVHADPHPGNFLVTGDGTLALVDFGCVLELTADERAAYARLVLAIGGGDPRTAAAELAALGFRADDPARLVELTGALIGALRPGANVAELDWQAAFAEQVAHARALGGLAIPRSFVLLGRVLATVAGLLATYRPRIALHPLIAHHLANAVANRHAAS
ncbi:MAG TPA: AarF/UbiB family protein [Kofleriaceae bacterium]|nr:AarF/UbiB family protein [Kofleriaceae bacterium]